MTGKECLHDDSSEDNDMPGADYMGLELLTNGLLDNAAIAPVDPCLASAPQWNYPEALKKQQLLFSEVGQLTDEDRDCLRRQCSSAPAVFTSFGLQPWASLGRPGGELTEQMMGAAPQQQEQPGANHAAGVLLNEIFAGLDPQKQVAPVPMGGVALRQPPIAHPPATPPPAEAAAPERVPLEVTTVPSCAHNHWERVTKKKNSISLRCRTCHTNWKTRLELFDKCTDFYAGTCAKGSQCPHPHIYSKAAEKYRKCPEPAEAVVAS